MLGLGLKKPERVEWKDVVKVAEELPRALAVEAKTVLGYEGLLSAQEQATRNAENLQTIAEALERLEIKPLDKGQVETYMRKVAKRGSSKHYIVSWTHQLIDRYPGQVPLHVLHQAVEIKKELPPANIGVAFPDRRAVDPFLFVELGGVKVYVAVWDEPGWYSK